MKRLIIAILSLWMSLTALHAANVVTVNGGDGAPGEQVTIAVALKTDAADVAAAEIRVPLPEGVEPVAGSLALSGGRAPDHSVTADMNGREYVIVLFNTSLKAIPTGDGELLTFKVALGDNPGRFNLTPKVKLSGSRGSAIASEATGGQLNLLAPRLEIESGNIDFGRMPLRSEVVKTLTVRNTGTTTLSFNEYTTGVEGLTAVMPQPLAEGESGRMELHYSPTVRSAGIDGRFTPVSNGVGRPPFVRIQAVPFSVNELHLGSATGICDEEVTVSVGMNNMEPIVGADFSIRLPEVLDFVEGSVAKGSRASAMSVESTMGTDRTLRIVMFGLSNKAVSGDDGELLSFRLKLKGRSGRYTLTLSNTVLANAAEENMTSQVYGSTVQISSPSLSASSEWAIGNVPLSGSNKFNFPLSNRSSVPLTIEKVAFLNDLVECDTPMPMVVGPYSEKDISVFVKEPRFGNFATTMNIYSNDPDNRMKSVAVNGNFYSPNEMSFAGRYAGGKYVIDASLTNEEAIAALQLDVVCPEGVSTDESLLKFTDRASGHSATLAKVGTNRYRVVIFSLKNAPFTGNEGVVFTLGVEGAAPAGKQIRIENIKLSSVNGVNITTPDSEIKLGELPTPVTAITLSQSKATLRVGGTLQLSATIVPTTASIRELKWTSSDPKIVNVDSNGKITAEGIGTAVITAAATDGSGVSTDCEITVEATPAEAVTLSATTLSLKVGESALLTATVKPDDATDKRVQWSVADPSVATVADGKVTAVALGVTEITAKCGDVTASCVVTVVPTPAESVTISQSTSTLKATETVQLTFAVAPETATDKSVVWSTSDATIATVSETGLVTALKVGKATITATATSGVKAECVVTVEPTPAESITLSQSTAELKVGESVTLAATVLPETTTDKTVIWTSSDESVATVNSNGKVSTVRLGEAIITAKCEDISATCSVSVVPTPAESLSLNRSDLSLKITESFKLEATISPETTTDKTVTWITSNDEVATIDADGKVTAVGLGDAVITAKCGEVSAICAVKVVPTSAGSITLDRTTAVLKATEQVQLTATILPETTTDKSVTWKSSNESIATVDQSCNVIAVAVGKANITATASSGVSATCEVTVVPTPAESITLSQSTAELKVGESVTLAATVLPETTTDKTVIWTSSDESVATVNSNGKVTAIALGDAVITAKCGEVSATCTVRVVPTPAGSITLDKTTAVLKATEQVQLTATILPETTTDKSVTWKSSNESIATVDQAGNVTAVAVGKANITATASSGVSATCEVTVVPTPAESITLNQLTAELKVGESVTLAATVLPETTTDKTVIWTSSDESVATVDSNGKVSAVRLGEAIITASCGNVSATCSVTVVPTPAQSITLSQTTAQLKVGESIALIATVMPANTTDKTVTWISSNEAVATIDANGKVTAVALGKATITAKCGEVSATCLITVVPTPAESVTLSQNESSLKVGESVTLTATVLPEDATDKTVNWISSNESIATVDTNGKVTAVALGNATITAKCGSVSATCEVSVLPILVESISLTPDVWSGVEGDWIQLVAVVLPEDATDKSLSWRSSDKKIAAVDSSGLVSIQAEGTCVVTVMANDGSGIEAQCIVTGLSAIEAIYADCDGKIDVYNLGGMLLKKGCDKAQLRQLTPGMYILRSEQKVVKAIVK